MANDSDDLQWIKNYLVKKGIVATDMEPDKLDRIRNFTLLWNLFESVACDKDANVTKISQAVKNLKKPIPSQDIDPHIEYFRKRYINEDGEPNQRFSNLNFVTQNYQQSNRFDSRIDAKDVVTKILKGEPIVSVQQDQLTALLYIVYRLRNNFFHGEKDISKLEEQVENFEHANDLIKLFLEIKG